MANRLLPPQISLPSVARSFHRRLPSLPHKLQHCKADGSRRALKAAFSKPQSRHLTPLKEGPGADLLDRRLSFVPLSLGPSNENLSAVPRFERKPPLCRKPSRQRMRVEFEDHLNVLTVGVCPAERKAWAAAGVRRGHVKGALTSLGVQTHFYDEETTDWVKTEP